MNMVPVSSSNLVAVGYDKATKVLRVQFNSGIYDYYDVPESIYDGLLSAQSKGQYHNSFIKHSFRYSKIN